jgi:hypothetical protein
MSSKKKSTQTNTYGWQTPPSTPATQQLQSMVQQGPDPSIRYAMATGRENLENSYQNPLGAATSPAVRDAANRVAGQRYGMLENQAIQESNFNNNQANFGRQSVVAGLQQPQLVQTGGQTVQSQPLLPSLLSAGASLGGSALTAF